MKKTIDFLAALPSYDWPPDAGGVIIAALRDRSLDAEERLLAAELAGDVIVASDDVQRTLLGVMADANEPEELRAHAAIALGPILEEADLMRFDEPEEVPVSPEVLGEIRAALHATYLDANAPKLLRRRALEAAVRGDGGWHEAAVRASYYSGDSDWRLTAIFCMAYVAGFDDELEEALDSDDPAEREEAERARDDRDSFGEYGDDWDDQMR